MVNHLIDSEHSDLDGFSSESLDFDHLVDLTDLTCPMLLVKMKQSLNRLTLGEKLLVKVTDPAAENDFKAFIAMTPHHMRCKKESGQWHFLITKND